MGGQFSGAIELNWFWYLGKKHGTLKAGKGTLATHTNHSLCDLEATGPSC